MEEFGLLGILIEDRIESARKKHPEGTTFEDITDEFLECYVEHRSNNIPRLNDELLDLITCCIRLLLDGDKQK